MPNKQRTLVIIKPDGVERGLIGEITQRIERRGFRIVGLKMMHLTRQLAEEHYAEHRGKEFYPSLLEFITSAPVVCIVLEGENVVEEVRNLVGATDPHSASPGTIRGDLAESISRNLIHSSDSVDKAEKEIPLFFSPEELFSTSA